LDDDDMSSNKKNKNGPFFWFQNLFIYVHQIRARRANFLSSVEGLLTRVPQTSLISLGGYLSPDEPLSLTVANSRQNSNFSLTCFRRLWSGELGRDFETSNLCFFVTNLTLFSYTYKMGWDLDILNKIKSKQLFT
jgi:hypothetical protein